MPCMLEGILQASPLCAQQMHIAQPGKLGRHRCSVSRVGLSGLPLVGRADRNAIALSAASKPPQRCRAYPLSFSTANASKHPGTQLGLGASWPLPLAQAFRL